MTTQYHTANRRGQLGKEHVSNVFDRPTVPQNKILTWVIWIMTILSFCGIAYFVMYLGNSI